MCVLVTGVQPCALPIYDSGIGCCRASQQQPGLSDQIQTDIRESYLFFELRCPRRPFGEALRTDERVVAGPEAVVRQRTEIEVIRRSGESRGGQSGARRGGVRWWPTHKKKKKQKR